MKDHSLTPELEEIKNKVIQEALNLGLAFDPIEFLLVSPKELNSIAAYGGFPKRITNWRFGQEFELLNKKYKYGNSKIYELVINTDPVYAYLLNTNAIVDQKLVMSHVCGHADFFKNNYWFKNSNKKMLDIMANNAVKVEKIIEKEGLEIVENFIDACESLNNLIDPHSAPTFKAIIDDNEKELELPVKLPAKNYMDTYINPKEFIQKQKKEIEANKEKKKLFPEKPERNILSFLLEYAPIKKWQKEILSMIIDEIYYFLPQRMTKITNEGWAVVTHNMLMTKKLANCSDIIDYCDRHSGVLAANNSLNPYKLGYELFKSIEDRWNRGAFGLEWERCDSYEEKKNWNLNLNKGLEKILQVRQTHNDITLIQEFLTPEFCEEQKLFFYRQPDPNFGFSDINKEYHMIKGQLLTQLTNGGYPVIELINANFENKGELFLSHIHDGRPLDRRMGQDCLNNLYKIWSRPVHLQTIDMDETTKEIVWHYDGEQHWITS